MKNCIVTAALIRFAIQLLIHFTEGKCWKALRIITHFVLPSSCYISLAVHPYLPKNSQYKMQFDLPIRSNIRSTNLLYITTLGSPSHAHCANSANTYDKKQPRRSKKFCKFIFSFAGHNPRANIVFHVPTWFATSNARTQFKTEKKNSRAIYPNLQG